MADISEDKQSQVVRITGKSEEFPVDSISGSDGMNRLLVKSETSISSALRIIQNTGLNVTLSDVTYYTIYSSTGATTISGFLVEFDDKKVVVRLVVDSDIIFDINCEALKDVLDWDQSPQPQTYISWNDGLKVFYFTPNFPIQSSSSLSIEVRSKTGQSKKYKSSIIQAS